MTASNNDKVIQATHEIARLCEALLSLEKEAAPIDGTQFRILAEGPLTEIQQLQEQIDTFLWEDEVVFFARVEGTAFERHNSSIAAIASTLESIRKSFQGVALRLRSLREYSKATLRRAADLRLVTTQGGSLKVGLRLPSGTERDGQPDMSRVVQTYMALASWAVGRDSAMALAKISPDWAERIDIITEFAHVIPKSQNGVDSVEIYSPKSEIPPARITAAARERVGAALAEGKDKRLAASATLLFEAKEVDRAGRIREINLDTFTFILRAGPKGTETRCLYDVTLAENIKAMLDRDVLVRGVPAVGAPGGERSLKVLEVRRLDDPSKQLPSKQ